MFPNTTFAALLLIALIPGYAYLRLTETVRRPRTHSALTEFLEVLAVGLGTTGLSAIVLVLFWPDGVAKVLAQASIHSGAGLRRTVLLSAALAGVALGLACIGALLTRRRSKGTFASGVWDATLGLGKPGHLPYVVLDLKDDAADRIEGVVHAYTALEANESRDIAITSPQISRGAERWAADADYVIVSAEEIAKIWFSLAPDPGHPVTPAKQS